MKNTIIVDGKRKTCRIYDAGESVADRYLIAFRGYRYSWIERGQTQSQMIYPYLSASDCPFHPQGFGQHGESRFFLDGKHLGKRVSFDSLPESVKKFILQSI
jgi:hypothetical protein